MKLHLQVQHTQRLWTARVPRLPDQLFGDVEALDNCDDDVTITWDVDADSLLEVNAEINVPASSTGCYTILRTYTLTDDCGNSTDIEQIIEVEDNTAPIYMGRRNYHPSSAVRRGGCIPTRRDLGLPARL